MTLAGLGSDTVASPRPKNRAAGRVQHSQEGPHPLAPPPRRPRGLPRSGGSHVQRATPNRSSRRQGTARRAGAPHGSAPPGTRTCRPTAATSTSLGNGGAPSATTRRGTLLQASGCPSSGAISGHRHRPPHAGSIASPPPAPYSAAAGWCCSSPLSAPTWATSRLHDSGALRAHACVSRADGFRSREMFFTLCAPCRFDNNAVIAVLMSLRVPRQCAYICILRAQCRFDSGVPTMRSRVRLP
jgi:hypothetical protein